MISVCGASKVFSEAGDAVHAFEDVSFAVENSEVVALVGPSGCGKTTLLRCIAGLESTTRGTITIDGVMPAIAREKGSLAFAAQAPVLLPWRRVIENVTLPVEVRRCHGNLDPMSALRRVGLESFASRYPHELSGGMRQRAAFARALVWAPSVLLLDEPFGALDEAARSELNRELRALCGRSGTTVLFVTHSVVEAVWCSDCVVVLSPRPGRIERIVRVELPRERELKMRSSAAFERALQAVRGALQ